ncbi:hypothetical protein [Neisseria lactamica]|uniref:hypothetical protein n=1 Tax=Neisseria lactamica TaxID=486 RepID=UPI000E58E612|nr:hypothetical protein [Neisseria lactamica]
MPSETPSFPQLFGIPVIFRHSRESGNLELLNFQTTFEYCRTLRHSRESGNLERKVEETVLSNKFPCR